MCPISVLLVDSNPTFLRTAARFLQQHDDIALMGTASGSEETLAQAQALQPQVVLLDLLDLRTPGLTGLDTISRLRSMLPEVTIIVLTLLDTETYRRAVLAAGADDIVSKARVSADLLPAIRRLVGAGEIRH